MRIITNNIFEEFNTVNIHPSLLPSYSMMMDMDIHRKVLLNKDQITGCTLHKGNRDCRWRGYNSPENY